MTRLQASVAALAVLVSTGLAMRAVAGTAVTVPSDVKLAKPLLLPDPKAISPMARQILKRRMDQHGDELQLLLAAVLMLNEPLVENLADRLAATPKLAKLGGSEGDTLNATLPPRFFVLQDELSARARVLAVAASTKDHELMGKTFGELANTCVACHSLYLGGPGDAR